VFVLLPTYLCPYITYLCPYITYLCPYIHTPCMSMYTHSYIILMCGNSRFSSVVQYVAVCCSVLQYFAVCCSVLQCVAVCCSVLQCVYHINVQQFTSLACVCLIPARPSSSSTYLHRSLSLSCIFVQDVVGMSIGVVLKLVSDIACRITEPPKDPVWFDKVQWI